MKHREVNYQELEEILIQALLSSLLGLTVLQYFELEIRNPETLEIIQRFLFKVFYKIKKWCLLSPLLS